jgi:hypothetical protein
LLKFSSFNLQNGRRPHDGLHAQPQFAEDSDQERDADAQRHDDPDGLDHAPVREVGQAAAHIQRAEQHGQIRAAQGRNDRFADVEGVKF